MKPFQEKILLKSSMNKKGLATELVRLYNSEAEGILEKLKAALQCDDSDAIRFQAHTLKGSASTVGAETASKTALEIETAAKREDLGTISKLIAKLEKQLEECRGEMERAGWL